MPVNNDVSINVGGGMTYVIENAVPDDEGKVDVYNAVTAKAMRLVEQYSSIIHNTMDDEQKDIAALREVNQLPNWQLSDWTQVTNAPPADPAQAALQELVDRTAAMANLGMVPPHTYVTYGDGWTGTPGWGAYPVNATPIPYAANLPGIGTPMPSLNANTLYVSQNGVIFYVRSDAAGKRAYPIESTETSYGNEAYVQFTSGNPALVTGYRPDDYIELFPGEGQVDPKGVLPGLYFSGNAPPVAFYVDSSSRCWQVSSMTPYYQPRQAELDTWKSKQQKMVTDLTKLSQDKQILLQDQVTTYNKFLTAASNVQQRKSDMKELVARNFT
jgi:hypothetical protein